jgi:hypothetical protein
MEKKKDYLKPKLEKHGKLEQQTQSGSPGGATDLGSS